LVRGGEEGIALTWMDARVNGVPITPRCFFSLFLPTAHFDCNERHVISGTGN
jgi:hypothetical protein